MSVIYTEPCFKDKDARGHGYAKYIREVYCTCGKKIGTQSKYDGWKNFSFNEKEKIEYKFCPYCGKDLKI